MKFQRSMLALMTALIVAGAAGAFTMDQKVVVASQFIHAVRVGAGGYSPEQRVAQINDRLNRIIAHEPLAPSNIQLRRVGSEPAIFVGRYLVTSVTQADAQANNTTPIALARRWLRAYRTVLPQARPDANWGVKAR